jgi:hypothetical protein
MGSPSTPDFGDIAVGQGEDNRQVVEDQIYANRPDQYTPWGYTKWTTENVDGKDRWTQTQGLTPEMQNELYKQQAIQSGKSDVAGNLVGRMGNEFSEAADWSTLSPMGGVPESQFTRSEDVQTELGDPTAMRGRAEDAIYDKGANRLNERFSGQKQALETKLRNQGVGPEDAAWKTQMQGLANQETDAYGNLQSDAVTQGRGEQAQAWNQDLQGGQFANAGNQQRFGQNQAANQQNYGMAMQGSQYANQIRQQQMTEEMQQRGFSLNEINALMSGQQVQPPGMPNFAQAESAEPAPLYQGAVDQSNAEQAAYQAKLSGVTDLAGAGLGYAGTRGV